MKAKRVPGTGYPDWKRGQAGAGNCVYPRAYHFFERKRILEGGSKGKIRSENEAFTGEEGFRLKHDDGKRWVLKGECF